MPARLYYGDRLDFRLPRHIKTTGSGAIGAYRMVANRIVSLVGRTEVSIVSSAPR